ncbi:MAG TPA: aldose 1-epimerase family protein [Streptosporangiaceae bacterium]|jgi:aldose 1-epimerase
MTESSATPLTGAQYDIEAGDYRATVTELGAGLRRLSYQGRPVITEYAADEAPPAGAGQLLAPWPNRVDGGRYTFDGAERQLDLTEPARGNAIHGLTRWDSWRPAAHDPGRVELSLLLLARPGYPFCLELTASYRLSPGSGLEVSVTARNAGRAAAPYGTGQHPYLTAGPPLIDECELQLPAAQWLPADERGIPAGDPEDVTGTPYDFRTARPIGDTRIDHALTGLTRDAAGRAWARLAGPGTELRFWAGPGYRWLQVFSGDALAAGHRRRALAIEPMTCPPNALVTGTDLLTLAPGDSVTHSWGLQAAHS